MTIPRVDIINRSFKENGVMVKEYLHKCDNIESCMKCRFSSTKKTVSTSGVTSKTYLNGKYNNCMDKANVAVVQVYWLGKKASS